ncbi:MAG: hypothetical protein KDD06_22820 [Phaeodactylibacter sp.]|nr:hypothetical protein [Phaeodactylibacter sp.]MCB9263688.1 hypothetical protein [Lewinellaceae bacterium]MCB9286905.1 hypothetical protein [Lewinellaceae bacterium]
MENAISHSDILFPSFLKNQRVYNLAEAYWRRFFHRLFDPKGVPFQEFYNKHFANGQKEYDANPIFDAYFPLQHKLVRIIQFFPEPDDLSLSGWIDHFPAAELDESQQPDPVDISRKNDPIPELVLSLAMTKKAVGQVEELLRRWVLEDIGEREVKGYLDELSERAC